MAPNALIETRENQDWRIGELLGSGNLAEVFAVQQAPQWAIKLLKPGVEQGFINDEARAITNLSNSLGATTRQVLPRIQSARVEGRPALLIERMSAPDFLPLREYISNFRTELEVERAIWPIALQYAEFIAAIHDAGYTCNDRKLGDFYYDEQRRRLVVLDWNVIERIDASRSAEGPRQDVKFMARAWFMLLGGMDEALFDLDTARMDRYTLAGRGFLWRALNPALRETTYRVPGRDLVQEVTELVTLIKMNKWDVQDRLNQLIQRQPLNTISAETPPELDQAILPYWQLADMLQRLDRQQPSVLLEIQRMRAASRRRVDDDVTDALQVSQMALEKLERHRSPLSATWDAYITQWQSQIKRLLQGAVEAGINPEPLREVVTQIQAALQVMLSAPRPATALTALNGAYDALTQVRASVGQSTEMMQNLAQAAQQLELYRFYLEGQQALQTGMPNDALSSFRQARDYARGLPADALKLLPDHPDRILKALEEIIGKEEPEFLKKIRQNLSQGNLGEAIHIYEGLAASGTYNIVQQKILHEWVRHAYRVQSAITPEQWCDALLSLQSLIPYAQTHGGWRDVVVRYLNEAYRVFQSVAKQQTRASKIQALKLGLLISHLHSELPNLKV